MLKAVNGTQWHRLATEKPGMQFYSLIVTRSYIEAPTHAHTRMRYISPQLLCWSHPNMVGDISMATAGRRGADLCGMLSRERLLFDF